MALGLHSILNVATRSLYTQQTAIEVTGHNITNINTPGYNRQEVELTPTSPVRAYGVYIGRGVDISGVKRNEDRFINFQIYRNSSILGSLEASARNAMPLQEIFNENLDEGLSFALNDFFNALGDLATAPEGQPERTAVAGVAETLVTNFHLVNSRLDEMSKAANSEVKYTMSEINSLAESIADLNQNIMSIEASGQNANDFRSQRSELMSQLSEKIDFNYFESDNGMVTIQVANGMPLVEDVNFGQLKGFNNPANNNYFDVYFEDINGNEYDVTQHIEGGSLKGVLDVRDTTVIDLRNQIDEMAYTLTEEFNALHSGGWTLNGTTGLNFFTPLSGPSGAAAAIEIDPAILADVNNIAAGQINEAGDNRNALLLAGIADVAYFNGGTWTFQDKYSSVVADVGAGSQRAIQSYEHQYDITTQVKNARESVVGVSLEEEMANLIKYQESYQASARLFNVVSELVDVLTSLK